MLRDILIVYETEAAARERLIRHDYAPEIATEIAVYLGQATDLPAFFSEIGDALKRDGLTAQFVELDDLAALLPSLLQRRDSVMLWSVTDGIRFYRGSAISALARLSGIARFGSAATAQHLCQDKFASLSLIAAAGMAVPATLLIENRDKLASLGDWQAVQGPLFVKPNTLGAKIGIFADSLCTSMDEALERCARIWERYQDRALIQPFISGDDVRVSYLAQGGALGDELGIEQLAKDPRSETGGAFMTMKDNETLSGAKDTSGTRGGFGAEREAAFVPRMLDLRSSDLPHHRRAVKLITAAVENLARLLHLTDYFSFDFRIDASGSPVLFEFEICPGITIYDFQNYLASRHGRSLGEALPLAIRLAFARRLQRSEA